MKISVADKQYVDMKIAQFNSTVQYANEVDVSAASPETIRSIITDLVRIVGDYVTDLEKNTKASDGK